jgi:hypothetical protein
VPIGFLAKYSKAGITSMWNGTPDANAGTGVQDEPDQDALRMLAVAVARLLL